ncbi:MAG: hypothetical protein LBC17_03910 [Lactobacillaceae bacterium]|jgi:hypothetical protein|nr:hypothetical protein [Lactobacillaceae bacterium]
MKIQVENGNELIKLIQNYKEKFLNLNLAESDPIPNEFTILINTMIGAITDLASEKGVSEYPEFCSAKQRIREKLPDNACSLLVAELLEDILSLRIMVTRLSLQKKERTISFLRSLSQNILRSYSDASSDFIIKDDYAKLQLVSHKPEVTKSELESLIDKFSIKLIAFRKSNAEIINAQLNKLKLFADSYEVGDDLTVMQAMNKTSLIINAASNPHDFLDIVHNLNEVEQKISDSILNKGNEEKINNYCSTIFDNMKYLVDNNYCQGKQAFKVINRCEKSITEASCPSDYKNIINILRTIKMS